MFSFPWWLSLLVGFLSLSEEILWVRVTAFGYDTLPPAFSFVLANYLVGIALGAAVGKRLCGGKRNLYAVAAVVLLTAGCLDVSMPRLVPAAVVPFDPVLTRVLALFIVVTAGLKSILFPIAHHLGATVLGPQTGRSVSRIYFGNIIGSTLGPVLTGFIALEYLSVDDCFTLVGVLCFVAAGACAMKVSAWRWVAASAVAVIGAGCVAWPAESGERGVLAEFAHRHGGMHITHMLTSRYGVIHTLWAAEGDLVYGTNVYDGIATANVDLNPNRLDRVYMLGLLHQRPARVLVVGLATGAWVRALQGFPGVERIDVVEINPAYLELIRRYPEVAPVLRDARVHIHIDDGRRWLKRNPDTQFDLVVQNTTWHWRANVSNLLSREYFTELRSHLAPGGVATFNTTGSFDVLRTAGAVFPYAYRYANFVYGSDRSLAPNYARLSSITRPDGVAFSGASASAESVVERLRTAHLEPVEPFIARSGAHATAAVITDDNLLTEYAHGRRFFLQLDELLPAPPPQFALDTPVLVPN